MMTKSKATKKALFLSVFSTLVCSAMLVGSTFAWFSDSAKTGTNQIVAGNLKVGLNYKDDDGNWADATAEEVKLFDDVTLWEPGAVAYEEFQVKNLGSLALKYALFPNEELMKEYVIAVPNTGDDAEDYPYIVTDRALGDVLYVATYPGTFEELVKEVNGALEPEGSYTTDNEDANREVVLKAIELGILPLDDNYDPDDETVKGTFGMFTDVIDVNGGAAWSYGALLPNGEKSSESWTYSFLGGTLEVDEGTRTVQNPSDTDEMTVILCWLPDHLKAKYGDPEFAEFVPKDNDYNLKNGARATTIPRGEGGDHLDGIAEAEIARDEWMELDSDDVFGYLATAKSLEGYFDDSGLRIDFAVSVFATQVDYEKDSFGNKYDEYVWPDPFVFDPEIE